MAATLETPVLGCSPEHADDPRVQHVITALVGAGHTPAPMSGPYTPTCGATGFLVIPHRPDQTLVFHLVEGLDTDADRRPYAEALLGYARDLDARADLRARIGLVGAVVVTDRTPH